MSMRGNPFEELERLFDQMSRQFDEASRTWDVGEGITPWARATEQMAVDVVDHDTEFVVTADLPGFEREDVTVRVSDRTLRIDADHEEETEETEEEFVHHERRHESMHRTVRLPTEVNADEVAAKMKNGVLTVTLPKIEAEEARTIDIE